MHLTDLGLQHGCPKRDVSPTPTTLFPGLGVRVSAGGAKSFVLLLGRSRKRVTIGRYRLISLSDARSHARELIAARLGKDDLPSMKFEEAIPIFLAAHFGDNYPKPRTRNEIERLLRRHFLPKFRFEQLAHTKPTRLARLSMACARRHLSLITPLPPSECSSAGPKVADTSPESLCRASSAATFAARERVLTREELKAVLHTPCPPRRSLTVSFSSLS